jgi:ketosteroid isomerase-like protein
MRTMSVQQHQEIAVVIEQYRRGFASMDAEELKALWDQKYDQIIYIAQELAHPLRGWVEVERYYQRIAGFIERAATMQVRDVAVDIFGAVAYVFLSFHFEGEIKGQPHIADGRVTFVLHVANGTWKIIHYHESRPGEF